VSNPSKRAMEMADSALAGWIQNSHDSLVRIIARACELAAIEERQACAEIVQVLGDSAIDPMVNCAAETMWEEIMARNGAVEESKE
jgi:hypothetical protein